MGTRSLRVLVTMAMVAAAAVVAVPATAVTTHRILVLDSLVPEGWTEATAINNGDTVVGSAYSSTGRRAVRWDRTGSVTDLGTLPGDTTSSAVAINDAGTVLGYSGAPAGTTAVVWDHHGTIRPLAMPPDVVESHPVAINAGGVAIGYAVFAGGSTHAVRWDRRGHVTDLGLWPGTEESIATSINDDGTAVGYSRTPSGDYPTHAVRWDRGGRITELTTGQGDRNRAMGISDDGTVIGEAYGVGAVVRWDRRATPMFLAYSALTTGISHNGMGIGSVALSISQTHAVRWDHHGRMTDLGSLPGMDNSQALAINRVGAVAGWAIDPMGGMEAVVWDRAGRITGLGSLDGNDSWAIGINDRGTIIGFTGTGEAVIWRR
jgi:probable HAF family extracellular repeat protein